MNILGVGTTEFVLILIIMLIVAGPKRMVHWAYILGKYMAQFRQMWSQMMDMVQAEFDEAGVDIKVPKEIPTRGDISRLTSKALQPIQKPLQDAIKEVENETSQISKTLKPEVEQAQSITKQAALPNGRNGKAPVKTEKSAGQADNPDTGFGTWSGIGDSEDQDQG